MSWKGRYRAVHPHKYAGNVEKIVYRSRWERDVMYHLDHNPNVLEWNSEEVIIPYISPLDNRPHRYFPDFYAKMKQKDGSVINVIIEVKPKKETIAPVKPKAPSKKYANAAAKYIVNEAKWIAAQEYCDLSGMVFKVMTEFDIYGPTGRRQSFAKKKSKKKSK